MRQNNIRLVVNCAADVCKNVFERRRMVRVAGSGAAPAVVPSAAGSGVASAAAAEPSAASTTTEANGNNDSAVGLLSHSSRHSSETSMSQNRSAAQIAVGELPTPASSMRSLLSLAPTEYAQAAANPSAMVQSSAALNAEAAPSPAPGDPRDLLSSPPASFSSSVVATAWANAGAVASPRTAEGVAGSGSGTAAPGAARATVSSGSSGGKTSPRLLEAGKSASLPSTGSARYVLGSKSTSMPHRALHSDSAHNLLGPSVNTAMAVASSSDPHAYEPVPLSPAAQMSFDSETMNYDGTADTDSSRVYSVAGATSTPSSAGGAGAPLVVNVSASPEPEAAAGSLSASSAIAGATAASSPGNWSQPGAASSLAAAGSRTAASSWSVPSASGPDTGQGQTQLTLPPLASSSVASKATSLQSGALAATVPWPVGRTDYTLTLCTYSIQYIVADFIHYTLLVGRPLAGHLLTVLSGHPRD
jgi:hypothetical protein